MTDPARWSDAGDGASDLERTLLRSADTLKMPDGDRIRVWSGISAALPNNHVPTHEIPQSTVTSLAVRHATLIQFAKALSVVALASGLSVAGYRVAQERHRADSMPSMPTPNAPEFTLQRQSRPMQEESVPLQSTAPASELQRAANPPQSRALTSELQPVATQRSPSTAPEPIPSSQLQQESNTLLAARRALRSNEPIQALRLLEQAQARFRPGMLQEERSALLIEALARSGNARAAATRAKSFLKSYPKSPHAIDVRQYLAP